MRSSAARAGYFVIRPLSDAAYFFLVSAARYEMASAPWVGRTLASGVYMRTRDGEIFRTKYSRLTALRRQLDPVLFVAIGKAFIVNVSRIAVWEGGHITRIGLRVGDKPDDVDLLPVSRQGLRRIRALIA